MKTKNGETIIMTLDGDTNTITKDELMENLEQHTEFETKYRVEGDLVYKFKSIVSELDYKNFVYAEGPDFYYTKPDGSFLRYRKAVTEKRAEVTLKEKPEGSKHNIQRKEVNWRVDGTDSAAIVEGATMMGYKFNFSIWKSCHIYNFKDATLVFYTVKDDNDKIDHFVEIELDEKSIHKLTYDEAMRTIRRYEEILAPLGITYRNRLSKSLYEMYVKDIDKVEPLNKAVGEE
jgi:adenylate cyclase class IV